MAPNVYFWKRLDFFNMKTLLQLLLAQKLLSCKGVLFKNNLLSSDTVPLKYKYNRMQKIKSFWKQKGIGSL